MRKYFLLSALVAAGSIMATPRSVNAMRGAAASQLAGALVKAQGYGVQLPVNDLRELAATETYRVFGTDELGFAIVASDDRFPAIIGYSATRFDDEALPCGLRWWLRAADEVMSQSACAPRYAETSYAEVENFIPTTWGQSDPYNWLCPKVNNRNTPAGCVATAMSQIMYYFRYPDQGTGKGGYTVEPSQSRQPATINGIYEWDKMLDSYSGRTLNDDLRRPVATLLKDVGSSVYMNYGASGSGAYSSDVPVALADNFAYNPLSLRFYNREYVSNEEWKQLVVNELQARRPVYYGAADEKAGGHAFFFSGLDAEGRVYVNWGWNGTGNGYYDIDLLTPTGILGRPGTSNFSLGQEMVIGIKPTPQSEAEDHYEAQICLPDSFTVKRFGKKLQGKIPYFYNLGFRPFEGVIGFYIVSAEEGVEPLFLKAFDTRTAEGPVASGYGNSINVSLYDVSELAAGEYRIYVAANDVLQGEYELARSKGGVLFYPLVKGEDGTMTVGTATLFDGVGAPEDQHPSAPDVPRTYFDLLGHRLPAAPAHGTFVVKQGTQVRKMVR